MSALVENFTGPHLELLAGAEDAAKAIPPLWPLSSSVAVNPFLGHADETLAQAAARLGRAAGIPVTLPRAHFAAKIAAGEIAAADLEAALAGADPALRPGSIEALVAAAGRPGPAPQALPTVADLAAETTGIDWPGIVADRIGMWAAAHFDRGQALWAAPKRDSAWAAWRAFASRDLTPEIHGLAGFALDVETAPQSPRAALVRAAGRMGIDAAAAPGVFHRLLMTLGGWAQTAAWRRWQAALEGGTDATLTDLLSVRLFWDEALFRAHEDRIAARWAEVLAAHATPAAPSADQVIDAILQDAAERAAQRGLAEGLEAAAAARAAAADADAGAGAGAEDADGAGAAAGEARPDLQAAFCIDVRSEVFRRALETRDPGIETLGFAGFFGLALEHRRFASDEAEARCPVLLQPALATVSGGEETATADRAARFAARARRAWGRFKLAAVSSFAFVEATGPVYAAKLVRDGLGLAHGASAPDPAPRPAEPLTPEARVTMARTVLQAMSLTDGFARLVILAGHGATVVNNPHAAALQCGACGGYSGEANARFLAGLLNEAETRAALAAAGVAIPDDTLFVAALHDTVTDAVTLYDADHAAPGHVDDIARAKRWLAEAGAIARGERAARLPRAAGPDDLARRAANWAEIRPEWGLAGCRAFVAAPRERTRALKLDGRSFLHDYDWRRDKDFRVLELIMTAPVVVASWISLQYYGSAVAPAAFGAGNKLLHNVTGGIGVVEGNGGTLRAGLPWQSVHDGAALVHEPLRLTVAIEAPRAAMTAVLERHAGLRALFDNGWLALFAMDGEGRMAWRYAGDLRWRKEPPARPAGADAPARGHAVAAE